MFNHSPAPWTLEPDHEGNEDEPYLELRADHGSMPLAQLYDSYMTDEMHDSVEDYEADLEQYRVNARLIAEAPMLLNHLNWCLDKLEELYPKYSSCDGIAGIDDTLCRIDGSREE